MVDNKWEVATSLSILELFIDILVPGWLAGLLAGLLAGWLACWLAGWLAGWLAARKESTFIEKRLDKASRKESTFYQKTPGQGIQIRINTYPQNAKKSSKTDSDSCKIDVK